MTTENTIQFRGRNLGDLCLLPGEKREKIEREKVLVVKNRVSLFLSLLLKHGKFHDIQILKGKNYTLNEEKQVLDETTIK